MSSVVHPSPIGVLIVDDQLSFRHVARLVIEATPDFVLLGEASSGEHAMAALDELHPDLVLVDVRMPGMDGIETATRLHSQDPAPVVVLISIEEPPHLPMRVASCGAAEIVRKQDFCPGLLRRVWQKHGAEHTA
ncbi:MAG: response regulator transcription factor [Thermoleophilaceae bacterium]